VAAIAAALALYARSQHLAAGKVSEHAAQYSPGSEATL